MSKIVYDATVKFCERFTNRYSRTTDQMIQAARSGMQNIAEASMASAVSKETEIKLTGVARASQEELLLDYQDFLRQHELNLWDKDDVQATEIRLIERPPLKSWPGNICNGSLTAATIMI
jgi:four helix bundle protein